MSNSLLRYAGVWNASTTYYSNNMVVSPLNNQAYGLIVTTLIGGLDPSLDVTASWRLLDTTPFGVYTEETGGSVNVSIPIPNLTSSGIVSICYVHAGGGGGSQYTKSITPSANVCDLVFNTAVDINDKIIWQVLSLS